MTTSESTVLFRQIRAAFEKRFVDPPSRPEVETFVRECFRSRNIRATPDLIDQTVAFLLQGKQIGSLDPKNIRPC